LSVDGVPMPNRLADSMLQLFDARGNAIARNDSWGEAQAADLQATGFAPGHPSDAAVLMTLSPGAYTAHVTGKNNATGVALVEIYELP
jgi:hypothetical protein